MVQVIKWFSPLTHSLEAPAFSSMTEKNLTNLNITLAGVLLLKQNLNERIMATMSLGQNELWSSTNMHRQLLWLQGLIPREVCNNLSPFALSYTLSD